MYINNPAQGKPISNGKMYFGEPDLDPEIFTNQKQVYYIQENGDLVAASQPILLSAGGNPTYNGDAVTLSITGEYSTKVLNKLGVQEYYIARTDSSGDSGSVISYAEDLQVLSAGQLVVDFTGITVAVANIYVGKASGDRGKLFEGDDYTLTGGSQITLSASFSAGTKLIAAASELVVRDTLSQSYNFLTVAEYKSFATEFPVGKVIKLLDREASFTVLSGTGTANGFNVIASDQVTQSISLTVTGANLLAYGAKASESASFNQGAIQAAIDTQSVVYGLNETYQHNSDFTGKSNLIFHGEKGFTLQCAPSYPQANQITFPDGVSNVKIHDVIFDMQNDINPPVLSSETLENSLNFSGCTSVSIYDCEFKKSLSRGIRLNGAVSSECQDIKIFRNRFIDGSKGGCQLRRYGKDVWMYKNYCFNSVDSSFGGSSAEKSLSMSGTINGWMLDNTIVQTNGDAGTIICEFIDRQLENLTVSGNKCQGCGDNSIKVGPVIGLDFFDNHSNDAAAAGFYFEGVKDFKIHDNFSYDSQTNSIVIAEDGDTSRISERGEVYNNKLVRANLAEGNIGSSVASAWVTATTVTSGQVVTSSGNVYMADSAGTTGATLPSHGSGSISDGSVVWTFIEVAGLTPAQGSYHIFTRGGSKDIVFHNNQFIEDSTTLANGINSADINSKIDGNDFSLIKDGMITIRNSDASGVIVVKDNLSAKSTNKGTATITAPSTIVTVNPETIGESDNTVLLTIKTILNGTVAYVYADQGANNQFVIRASDSSHGTPTVSADIDINWCWSAINAQGTFGKSS
jgi:hypothetical protein